ncbi:MAG: magnesium transporter [Spirochaetes bacterium]|nr:magnesium transporter [Spirochaetota bacterium]
MFAQLLQPEIRELIDNKNFAVLKDVFSNWPAADLAELLSGLDEDEQPVIFRLLPRELSAQTFEHLNIDAQKNLMANLGRKMVAGILNEMSPDDRTALLEELPGKLLNNILSLLSKEERDIAKTLLGYPENSVGRLMTPDYIAVRENLTVSQVLDHIRKKGHDSETLDVIFVIDGSGYLKAEIKIRQLLLSHPRKKVSDIMDDNFPALSALDDQERAVFLFKKYDVYALPVLDSEGVLLGIVTVDDVLDVAEEEVTEDIHKMGGMEALEDPYMEEPILRLTRKRAGWLVVLFLGELLTATAMSYFEEEIARAVVLTLFLPLIISSGGNSGSQASTLVIRSMAIGEISLRDWWRVLYREIASGLMLGLILGAVGFMRVAFWHNIFGVYGVHWFAVGTTLAITLLGVVMWGTIIGAMLPFILKRFRLDPATSSAPFVATIVDVIGLLIYFNVAYLILKGSLL